MYSKITHNIVEEHYDGMPMPQEKRLAGLYDGVLPENTPRAIQLRQGSRDMFTQFDNAVRDYLQSSLSKIGDPTLSKDKILGNLITYFSRIMTGNWYSAARVEPVVSAWQTFCQDILAVIDVIVAKQDRVPVVDKARMDIEALATAMVTAAQPTGNLQWTMEGTSDLLNSYLDDIIEEVMTREEQNWTKDRELALSAYRKLVTGTDTMAGLADIISLGIIRQVPGAFQISPTL